MINSFPAGVPAPKFQMFQKVSVRPCRYCQRKTTEVGTVVGMEFISALDALVSSISGYGWRYQISYVFGKTPEEAVSAFGSEETSEEDLQEVASVPAN